MMTSNQTMSWRLCAAVGAILLVTAGARAQAPREQGRLGIPIDKLFEPWTGDLDGMMDRRLIRILTVYNRTLYFVDKGTPRGTAYDQGKLLEDTLNKKRGPGQLPISVQFLPVSRDELVPSLLQGRGDIIMAQLTVTPD